MIPRNFGAGGEHFRKLESLVAALRQEMRPGTTALIKGSRFMRMERVIEALLAGVDADVDSSGEREGKRAARAERMEGER